MAPEPLAVWLDGRQVAVLETRRRRLRLAYTDEARRAWPLGTPLASVAMPLSERPYGARRALPFFEGLLPEGEVRRTIAFDLGVDEADAFGLLAALGRDCAGALVLQPASDGPPPRGSESSPEPIDDAEVARRIAALRLAPLGVDGRVRVSLPGMQHKLLLARLADGSWGLPVHGAPSTHILKPPVALLVHSVENEAFCMRVAHRAGLEVAAVEVDHVGGDPVLVVERFDRDVVAGVVHRIHQEDACQALSVPTERKYEERGGPSLRDVAGLLRDWQAPTGDLPRLLRATTFAVVVGDADRHAKNVSIAHGSDGRIHLTPLYDVMCTRFYPDVSSTLGMFVNGQRDIDAVAPGDLVDEGMAWGLDRGTAQDTVAGVVDTLPGAIEAEAEASPWVSPALRALLLARATAMRSVLRATTVSSARAPAGPEAARGSGASASADDRVWVAPYRRTDGTTVRGHWRQPAGARRLTPTSRPSPPG